MTYIISQSLHQHIDKIQEAELNNFGSFYITNIEGVHLTCNQTMLDWAGLSHIDEFVGKTCRQTPWAEYADQFEENNQYVISTNQANQFFEHATIANGQLVFAISYKKPFYYQDKVIGICGWSQRIKLDQLACSRPLSGTTIFVDTRKNHIISISQRRKKSLYWLLQGLSTKEIASRCKLSVRTIEHHIEHIRRENGYESVRAILLWVRAF